MAMMRVDREGRRLERETTYGTYLHLHTGYLLTTRVAVDMKYHIHIHIHIHRCFVDIHGYIHIHRCLSCVNVYAVNNYKKHSCFLLSTGSIFTVFITKQKMKKHTQVRSVLCYRVSVQKKITKQSRIHFSTQSSSSGTSASYPSAPSSSIPFFNSSSLTETPKRSIHFLYFFSYRM